MRRAACSCSWSLQAELAQRTPSTCTLVRGHAGALCSQLKTHRSLFREPVQGPAGRADPPRMRRYVGYLYFQLKTHHSLFMEEENDEEPNFSAGAAISLLCIITILVAFASECAPRPAPAAAACPTPAVSPTSYPRPFPCSALSSARSPLPPGARPTPLLSAPVLHSRSWQAARRNPGSSPALTAPSRAAQTLHACPCMLRQHRASARGRPPPQG